MERELRALLVQIAAVWLPQDAPSDVRRRIAAALAADPLPAVAR